MKICREGHYDIQTSISFAKRKKEEVRFKNERWEHHAIELHKHPIFWSHVKSYLKNLSFTVGSIMHLSLALASFMGSACN